MVSKALATLEGDLHGEYHSLGNIPAEKKK
jgi:hypothetical protein